MIGFQPGPVHAQPNFSVYSDGYPTGSPTYTWPIELDGNRDGDSVLVTADLYDSNGNYVSGYPIELNSGVSYVVPANGVVNINVPFNIAPAGSNLPCGGDVFCSGQRKDHSLNCPVPLEYWVSPPKFLWSSYERRGDALGFHVAPRQFFFASSERPKIEQSPLIYESPPRLKIRVPFTSFTSPRFTFECQHGTRLSGPPHAWDVPLVFTAFEPCKMRVVYHSFWFTAGKQSRSIRLSANHVDLQLTKGPTCRRSPSMRRPPSRRQIVFAAFASVVRRGEPYYWKSARTVIVDR